MDDAAQQTQEQSPQHSKPWLFKPGVSANPGGRPKGARNKLQGDFFNALANDFAAHGKQALEDARKDNPAGYLKVVASLMPKELTIRQPLEEISDEQLDAAAHAVRAILNAQSAGASDSGAGAAQSTEVVRSVPETA